jgi:putative FmdB family regulatory protein
MPTYDYVCSACEALVEYFQSMSEKPKKLCPECGARKLVRQIGAGAGILFKGSGFYQTDYRSSSYQQAAAADSKGADCTGDTKSCAASGGPCADASTPAAKPDAKPASKSASGPASGSAPGSVPGAASKSAPKSKKSKGS